VPTLDPGLVLFGFLPPLLFDAAFRLDTREARLLLRPILLLAVPGTLLTAFVVGGIVAILLNLPVVVGLLFGSLVAATDPVAVIGVFKGLRARPRLAAIAESESLINDGVAITIYTAVLGLALTETGSATEVLRTFGQEVMGGVLIGGLLGFAFSRLTGVVDDHLIEMMLSLALAYGSYVAAQSVHASGPLACVAVGVIHGSYGRQIGMSESARRLLDDLWEFLGFVANAIVFVLVGFTANLAAHAWPAAAAGCAPGALRPSRRTESRTKKRRSGDITGRARRIGLERPTRCTDHYPRAGAAARGSEPRPDRGHELWRSSVYAARSRPELALAPASAWVGTARRARRRGHSGRGCPRCLTMGTGSSQSGPPVATNSEWRQGPKGRSVPRSRDCSQLPLRRQAPWRRRPAQAPPTGTRHPIREQP
jgi:hypothetical protein